MTVNTTQRAKSNLETQTTSENNFLVEWDVWVSAVDPASTHYTSCRKLVNDILKNEEVRKALVTDVAIFRTSLELESLKPVTSHPELARYIEAITSHAVVVTVTAEQLRAATLLSRFLEIDLHACCTMKVALDMGASTIISARPLKRRVPGIQMAIPGSGEIKTGL